MRYPSFLYSPMAGAFMVLAVLIVSPPWLPAFNPGADGSPIIVAANTVVNQYATLSADAASGDTSVTVNNRDTAFPTLAVGDLLLIYQARGATINTDDDYNYGAVTDLGSAGRYELVTVGAIPAAPSNAITITTGGCGLSGLRYSYTVAGNAQVVRVPQYENLTINPGASIVPVPWNGTFGGVLAIHVAGTLTVNGEISGTGRGFRGGPAANGASNSGSDTPGFRTSDSGRGAPRGEGIASQMLDNTSMALGVFGRGAPANGGGGGNDHNAGGGGGANGWARDNSNNPIAWDITPDVPSASNKRGGQGVMPSGWSAWTLDPGYIDNGNALTNNAGGGRGGYTFASSSQDPLSVPPGDALWGGNRRRERGGLGGRPLENNPDPAAAGGARLFLGGGGGAGDGNNSKSGSGGNGGALLFVMANTVEGTGSIISSGAAGANMGSPFNGAGDAPGGGGAGGSIVVRAASFASTLNVAANGGKGGDQLWDPPTRTESEGPGGGGGGGYIAITGGTPTRTAAGGLGGVNNNNHLLPFAPNGATNGNVGQPNEGITGIAMCRGMLEGFVFNDSFNNDGIYWPGPEVPLDNATIEITFSDASTATVTTDANGRFRTTAPQGTTVTSISIVAPYAGYTLTTANSPQNVAVPAGISGTATSFGLSSNPLFVSLESFEARIATDASGVELLWVTGAEIDNMGFHVFRAIEVTPGVYAPGERLTSTLIAPEGQAGMGAEYRFFDAEPVLSGETRAYFLMDLDASGLETLHGPAVAEQSEVRNSVAGWQAYGL